MASNKEVEESRQLAVERHDLDSALFFNRYLNFSFGKYTDEFIYGRHMIVEEITNDLATLPKGATVLDVGCGTGHLAEFIHQKGFDVKGVEPAVKMIAIAKKLFPHIEFKDGISAQLPFADNTFDYIISIEVLRYLNKADVEASYIEFKRVLKPGGKILVTQVNRSSTDGYILFYNITHLFKSIFNLPRHYCFFTNRHQEVRMLKRAGYSDINVTGRMFGFIRIFYKFGKTIGKGLTKVAEMISPNQNFKYQPGVDLSGHLIVRAVK